MKNFSPSGMKEAAFPTPHTLTPKTSFKLEVFKQFSSLNRRVVGDRPDKPLGLSTRRLTKR